MRSGRFQDAQDALRTLSGRVQDAKVEPVVSSVRIVHVGSSRSEMVM